MNETTYAVLIVLAVALLAGFALILQALYGLETALGGLRKALPQPQNYRGILETLDARLGLIAHVLDDAVPPKAGEERPGAELEQCPPARLEELLHAAELEQLEHERVHHAPYDHSARRVAVLQELQWRLHERGFAMPPNAKQLVEERLCQTAVR